MSSYYVLRMIFMGAETIFCMKFHHAKFPNNCLVSYGLVIVLAGNISLWFEAVLYEVQSRHGNGEADDLERLCGINSTVTFANDMAFAQKCFHRENEEFSRLKSSINPYFYPLTIEHSLLVGEWLLGNFFHRRDPVDPVLRKFVATIK